MRLWRPCVRKPPGHASRTLLNLGVGRGYSRGRSCGHSSARHCCCWISSRLVRNSLLICRKRCSGVRTWMRWRRCRLPTLSFQPPASSGFAIRSDSSAWLPRHCRSVASSPPRLSLRATYQSWSSAADSRSRVRLPDAGVRCLRRAGSRFGVSRPGLCASPSRRRLMRCGTSSGQAY